MISVPVSGTTLLRRERILFFASIILAGFVLTDASAQEKIPLDHEDVTTWNHMQRGSEISPDGDWLMYGYGPAGSDSTLKFKSVTSETEYTIEQGANGKFSGNSLFAAFNIVPSVDSVRAAKLANKLGNDLPQDKLGILNLSDGSVEEHERVESFKFPEKGGHRIAFRFLEGNVLTVQNLADGTRLQVHDVTDYEFSQDGRWLAYARSSSDGKVDGTYVLEEGTTEPTALMTGQGNYKQIAMSKSSTQIAFLSDRDDYEADDAGFALYKANLGDDNPVRIASEDSPGLPEGWCISDRGSVYFSDSGENIYFRTSPRPEQEPDELPEEERIEIDIWSWTDDRLQPKQLKEITRDRDKNYLAVVRSRESRVVQLESEQIPTVYLSSGGDGLVVLGLSNHPYEKDLSWDYPSYSDAWLINAATGEKAKILERVQARIQLSPEGRYVFWWDGHELAWFALSTDSMERKDLSARIPFPVFDETHDRPQIPKSYEMAGWTEGDTRFVLYDKHDIWIVTPHDDSTPVNITDGLGRKLNIEFRIRDLDRSNPVVETGKDLLIQSVDLETMDAGFWVDRIDGQEEPRNLYTGPYGFGFPYGEYVRKAENADVLYFFRQSYAEFPNIWTADLEFNHMQQQSDINPQQENFRWGTVELHRWTALDGQRLTGLLYKPDGFSPGSKYPMLVNFYERESRLLHMHHAPAAGDSEFNRTFYVSRGYIVFVPDIAFKEGYPGESAMNAVIPGVNSLVDLGFVDADRIGLGGHSWGGYQVAYMITQTNMFAAAYAGALVSNMSSAYGALRSSGGNSRAFMYEKTQSRIGGTPWDSRHLYIQNSPIFMVDKVETPLLMMHNENDGAVPWSQSIEYFTALRRLGKPAWMVNYNGEYHVLSQYKNRKDWAVRMQQFYDHYLKEAPAPVWLKEGVPALKKGQTLGLELMK